MNRVISAYSTLCRRIAVFGASHALSIMLVIGVGLIVVGLADVSWAQSGSFDEEPLLEAGRRLLDLIEGSFGALVMIVAGLVAIIAAAMGAYKASMAALIVAVGAFILRSMVTLFFDVNY